MKRKNVTTRMMKEYIAESLLLLMKDKIYAGISISEIAARAGVNRSTYYRNFSSKEEIIKFYFANLLRGYSEEYKKSNDDSLENYMRTIFTHFYKRKKELLRIHKNGLSYILLETLNQTFEENKTKSLAAAGQYKTYFHIGGIYNTYILWFTHGMKETPAQLTRISLAQLPAHAKPMLTDLFLK